MSNTTNQFLRVKMRQFILCMSLICLLLPYWSMADTGMSKLKEQWHFLTKNIEAFDLLLYKNKQQQNQLLQRSNLLKTQIDQRVELMNLIEQEIKQLDEVVVAKQLEINLLECELETHFERYNVILTNSYRNHIALKPVYYIFSSKGFWNAYNRWQYIQSFNSLLKSRSNKILDTRANLQNKRNEHKEKIRESEHLLEENQCQRALMTNELMESNALIKQLQESGKHFNNKLKKHKSSQALLEQYYPANMAKQATASPSAKKDNQLNTKAFLSRKGAFNWPVKKNRIAKRHGNHKHPKFPDVSYYHNGIDIRTNSSTVSSIQGGEVVDIFKTPGHKYTVLVQHGEYFSLYGNLASVTPVLGDQIKAGQAIGKLERKIGDKTNKLHLEIWKTKEGLNPQDWLKK